MPGAARDPLILLSFDVEEFDIVAERGRPGVSVEEQFDVGRRGLERVLRLLDETPARPRATLFTTGVFAERFPALMRQAAARHEIASHGYTHGALEPGDLERSKKVLEDVCGVGVRGFRRARMAPTDVRAVERAGYAYNSSEHPVWLPGRSNNFFGPRRAYVAPEAPGVVNIPVSATPLIRLPMFWLAFKNFPEWVNRLSARWTLAGDGVVNFYWHPWEFVDIGGYGLPGMDCAVDGERLCARWARHVEYLARFGRFATFGEYTERMRAHE